jgi:hypothetical protein
LAARLVRVSLPRPSRTAVAWLLVAVATVAYAAMLTFAGSLLLWL